MGWMPHGHCYFWEPGVYWAHVMGDALTALSYVLIAVALAAFSVRNRARLPSWVVVLMRMFGAFILACGATHMMAIYTTHVPAYWAEAVLKVACAGISLATAAACMAALRGRSSAQTLVTALADLRDAEQREQLFAQRLTEYLRSERDAH